MSFGGKLVTQTVIRCQAGGNVADKTANVQYSDVAFWGMVAMLAGAVAMLSLTLSAVVPASVLGGLRASRIPGGNINQLRAQVARLSQEQTQMLSQTRELRTRLSLADRGRGEVIRRVGALETTIPMLLEVVPPGSEIDPLSITAAIDDTEGVRFEAQGGYVTVSQRPLFGSLDVQALPPPLSSAPPAPPSPAVETGSKQAPERLIGSAETPASGPAGWPRVNLVETDATRLAQTRYGIAIGALVQEGNQQQAWRDLSAKIGTLLIGLAPAISDPLQNGNLRLIAGPIADYGQAQMLCTRITRVGIDCLPVQYASEPAPPS